MMKSLYRKTSAAIGFCWLLALSAGGAQAASDACVAANATFSASNDQQNGSPLSSPIPWSEFKVGETVTVVFNINEFTVEDDETVYWDSYETKGNYEDSGDGYFGATDNSIIPNGGKGPVTFSFTVSEEARDSGTELTLATSYGEVTVSCEEKGGDPAGFNLEKSSPVPPLQAGRQSTYSLSIETTADTIATEVKDQLPEGMTLVSAGGNGWKCDVDGGNLVLCQKQIARGAIETIPVTVMLDDTLAAESLTNYASAGSAGRAPQPGSSCQPDGENTTACALNTSDVDARGNFTLEKSQPVPPLQANRQSTYTLSVTTDGENVPVDVKDQLPAGMTLVSASGTGWTCHANGQNLVLCQKVMSKGSVGKIQVTVNVEAEINDQDVTNYASAAAEGRAPQPGPACATDTGGACASSASKVADVREKIRKAVGEDVQAFMAARLDQIVASFDPQSRLQRFRNTACGVSHDMSMSGDATSHDQNLAANGSFSMKGTIVPTADVPDEQCGRFNLWTQVDGNYVNGAGSTSASGGMLMAGAEYLITDNFLAGVRLSIDYMDASFDSAANSEITGYGWLAGPYISAQIAQNVFLDGFLGYGTSWNDYSGRYDTLDLSGDFTTQRIAGYLNLSGNYRSGAVLLTPMVGVSYGKEWSNAFGVDNDTVGGTSIDSQDAGLGRLTGRIEAGYLIAEQPGERCEVFMAPQVTYDMVRNGGDDIDMLLGDGLWRAGVEGGLRYAKDRLGASLLVGYDGIGTADWSAIRGQVQVNYTW